MQAVEVHLPLLKSVFIIWVIKRGRRKCCANRVCCNVLKTTKTKRGEQSAGVCRVLPLLHAPGPAVPAGRCGGWQGQRSSHALGKPAPRFGRCAVLLC